MFADHGVTDGSSTVGDILGWLIVIVILAAAFGTMGVAAGRTYNAARRRGWSKAASDWSAVGVGFVMFCGGWVLLDIWWLLKAIGRSARWAWAFAR